MGPASFLLLAATAGVPATAPAPASLQCQSRLPDGTCPEQIGFADDDYARMTVDVQVGGKGPYRFLVDTGANRSVVSSRLVQSLGLQSRGGAVVHSAAGISKVDMVRVPRIELPSRAIDGLDAPVLKAANMGADGILGVDTLRAQRIVIDFKNAQMYLTPSPRREPRLLPNEIVIVGRLRSGHLILTDVRVDGEIVTAVVDTGAQLSMGNGALRRMMERHRRLGPASPVQTIAVTGQVLNGDLHLVHAIEFDGVTLSGVEIMFAEAETFRAIGRENKPTLLLGMNALRAFEQVAIDLDARKLRLRIPAQPTISDKARERPSPAAERGAVP